MHSFLFNAICMFIARETRLVFRDILDTGLCNEVHVVVSMFYLHDSHLLVMHAPKARCKRVSCAWSSVGLESWLILAFSMVLLGVHAHAQP